MTQQDLDQHYMRLALEEAKKGIGFTSPNPCVGAVLVRNKKVVGIGYHKKAGTPHAEIHALRHAIRQAGAAGTKARGADLYVTLEPCAHTGKTPPCVGAVITAGIKRVIIGMRDPFPRVNGKGIQLLKKAGIEVVILPPLSDLAQEIREINQPFLKSIATGFPYVTLKAGISLDGAIATRTGESQWITSLEARTDARIERSKADVVLVGVGTVLADNPELAAHGKWKNKTLYRVIIDPLLSSPVSSKVFRDEAVFVATTDQASKTRQQAFQKAGIAFESFGKKRVSIPALLKQLNKEGVQSVYVEGGAGVHGSFVDAAQKDARCVDRVLFYIAPKIIGGVGASHVIGGEGAKRLDSALVFEDTVTSFVGDDIKVEGTIQVY